MPLDEQVSALRAVLHARMLYHDQLGAVEAAERTLSCLVALRQKFQKGAEDDEAMNDELADELVCLLGLPLIDDVVTADERTENCCPAAGS